MGLGNPEKGRFPPGRTENLVGSLLLRTGILQTQELSPQTFVSINIVSNFIAFIVSISPRYKLDGSRASAGRIKNTMKEADACPFHSVCLFNI